MKHQRTKSILKNFDRIDTNSIADSKLAARVAKLQAKRKQGGFTLLELLVVVAILAAIAGTATIALQDTDARAAAAAHVAMMDELNKGIRTFRVLNGNAYPDAFDSLLQADAGVGSQDGSNNGATGTAALANFAVDDSGYDLMTLDADMLGVINDIGIENVRVAYGDATAPAGSPGTTCGDHDGTATDLTLQDLETVIGSRSNAMVAGNVYMTAEGCGDGHALTAASNVMIWTGGSERITGTDTGSVTDSGGATPVAATAVTGDPGAEVFMMVGTGPNSSLFNANDLGGLSSVPVYRHVSELEYNRFIALFQIGTIDASGTGVNAVDQVSLAAVVDGAGDTKEEELGEWDGTRNTI